MLRGRVRTLSGALQNVASTAQFRPETARGALSWALGELVHRCENGATGRRWGAGGGPVSLPMMMDIKCPLMPLVTVWRDPRVVAAWALEPQLGTSRYAFVSCLDEV